MIGLWWVDTVKLIGRRRWLAVPLAFALVGIMNIGGVLSCMQVSVNIWDGVLGSLGSWLFFRFIILLLFVFLTTDTVLDDIMGNWAWLTLPRSPGRIKWWTVKVVSLFTASVFYFFVGTLVLLLISGACLPYEPTLSQFACGQSYYSQGLPPLAFPADANPIWLITQFVLYSALAAGAFALIPVTLSLVIRKSYVVALIPTAWIFLSHFWQSNRFFFRLDLIPRLFYGVHFMSTSGSYESITFGGSLLYILLVICACYSIGALVVRKADF